MSSRRVAVATAAVVAVIIGANAAWALWQARGTGSVSSTAATSIPIQTVATTGHGSLLFPGGHADLLVNVKNSNPFPIQVHAVLANGTIKADDAHRNAGCTDAANGVSFEPFNDVDWALGPSSTQQFTLIGVVTMSNSTVNACQGATFSVPIRMIAASNA